MWGAGVRRAASLPKPTSTVVYEASRNPLNPCSSCIAPRVEASVPDSSVFEISSSNSRDASPTPCSRPQLGCYGEHSA
jgi:hypothetical protein